MAERAAAHVIENARLPSGETATIAVDSEGRITKAAPADAVRINAGGRLVTAGFAEPHAHVDRAFSTHITGVNESGTLPEAIERSRAAFDSMTVESLTPGAVRALRLLHEAGVSHVKNHTVIGGEIGFRAWDALEEAARHVPDVHVIQVPMPADPNAVQPELRAWLREAAARGAPSVGGAPWLSDDPDGATRVSAEVAADLGLGLDLHVDETDDPSMDTLDVLAESVVAFGLGGRTAAHHCCSLGRRPPDVARRQGDNLAESGVAVVVCPVSNMALQGRTTGGRGLAPVRILREAGVAVGIGIDNIRDVVVSVGTGDPLRAAWLTALATHLLGEGDLDWVGRALVETNRHICALPSGMDPGDPADLLAVDADCLAEAVALVPPRRWIRLADADKEA
jgi:cytosine deaminase